MRRDIRLVRGSTFTLSGTARQKDGTVIDLTGATLAWRFGSRDHGETESTLTPTAVSATAGTYLLTIAPSDTSSKEPGHYRHQGEVTEADGTVTQILEGDFTLDRDYTS